MRSILLVTGLLSTVALADGTAPSVSPNATAPQLTPKIIFATSTTHSGALGGLDGADALCQATAEDAGLSGGFMAWLSDSTLTPSQRFRTLSLAPYINLRGEVVAAGFARLSSGLDPQRGGPLFAAVRFDEHGEEVAGVNRVWTGTTAHGATLADNCDEWNSHDGKMSGRVGRADQYSAAWTDDGNVFTCNAAARLYCVEQ